MALQSHCRNIDYVGLNVCLLPETDSIGSPAGAVARFTIPHRNDDGSLIEAIGILCRAALNFAICFIECGSKLLVGWPRGQQNRNLGSVANVPEPVIPSPTTGGCEKFRFRER
jgi:hypothetical protein